MMQLIRKIFVCLLLGVLCWGTAWAKDFARMSNQELADLRGVIQNAPEDEQTAFLQEWEKRLADMFEEEKKIYAPLQESSPGVKEKKIMPFHIMGQGYENQDASNILSIRGGTLIQDGEKDAGK